MVEGYDAADPRCANTFALRDEWMRQGIGRQGRVAKGCGVLIAYLLSNCRGHGVALRLGAAVAAIAAEPGR
jgi:phytoene dehydrogenase-like protein